MRISKKNCGKKRTVRLFGAVWALLFLGCFFLDFNVFAKEHERYTSVSVEFKDANTGEIFQAYTHPWQRVGKKYTYYMEDVIWQEGKGTYMYDENHLGTVSEIAALSEKAEDNRIVLYYKLYGIKENEYAVNITYKDAATEEIISTEVRVIDRLHWNYYAVDMEYCITGSDGRTYLYDTENSKNVPAVKIEKNALRNQIVLYYREGGIAEGEAIVEVYYREGDWLWEKSFISGLTVGEEYYCWDTEVLYRLKRRKYENYDCHLEKEDCSLEIQALSENGKENRVEIQVKMLPSLTGVPPWYETGLYLIRYVDEDTGNILMDKIGGTSLDKIFHYCPTQIFYSENGKKYYFDNTKAENILDIDGRDHYQVYDEERREPVSKCRGEIKAYYRPVRKDSEAADVCVNYLDADAGLPIKTETIPNAAVGSAYSHTPKKTFAFNGILYTFDRKNAGNHLTLQTVSGHPDIDQADAYYTGKSLKKLLKTPKIKKLFRKGGKSAKLKLGKIQGVSGYQAVYAYNKKFKSAKKLSSKKPDITLKKLKKGKPCYVKVRAYIQTDEGKIYGAFGRKKKLK